MDWGSCPSPGRQAPITNPDSHSDCFSHRLRPKVSTRTEPLQETNAHTRQEMTDILSVYMGRRTNSAEHLVRNAVVLSILAADYTGTHSVSGVTTSGRAGTAALAMQSLSRFLL